MGDLNEDGVGADTKDRGMLVSEPSPEQVLRERMVKLKVAAAALIVGSVMAVFFTVWLPSEPKGFIAMNMYFAILTSIMGSLVALGFIVWFIRYEPQRVYTRGVSLPRFPGGDRFMPWGRYKKVIWHGATVELPVPQGMERTVEKHLSKVVKDEQEDDRIELWEPDDTSTGSLTITRDAPAFYRIVELASERVNDPGYDSPEYLEGVGDGLRDGILQSAMAAMLMAAVFAYLVVEIPSLFGYGLELYLAYLFTGTTYLFLMWQGIEQPKKWAELARKAPGNRTPVLTTVAVTVLLLVATTVSFSLASGTDLHFFDPDTEQEPDPGWSFLAPGTYVNETLHGTGPIRVGEGETLTLLDCDIAFDMPPAGTIGIWVAEGGHLEMVRTNVTMVDSWRGYYIEVYGSAVVQGCLLERLWQGGEGLGHNRDSGLEVYSDDVRVENTTFRDCSGNAIMVVGASPMILDCTFVDILDDGIESVVASPWVEGCTFRNCSYGAIMWGSGGTIRDCAFEGGGMGVGLMSSDTDIVDCSFDGLEDEAIYRTWDCEGSIEGVTYGVNGEDLVTKRWTGIMGTQTVVAALDWYCVVLVVVSAVMGLSYILLAFMKELRRVDRTEAAVELEGPGG